jgi:hypothetical protein
MNSKTSKDKDKIKNIALDTIQYLLDHPETPRSKNNKYQRNVCQEISI